REVMSASACSTQMQPQPPRNLAAGAVANGVRLSWASGGSSNVLGYEILRSHDPLDIHPVRLGFTPAQQWDDPGIGWSSSRVRPGRSADTSSACPEVRGTSPCGLATGPVTAAGNQPVAAIAGDWNADGREDLLVVRQGDSSLGLLLGQGT